MTNRILSVLCLVICLTSCSEILEEEQASRYSISFEVGSEATQKTALQTDGQKVSYIWKNESQNAFEFIQSANGTIRIEPSTSFSVGIGGKAAVGAEFSQIPGAVTYDYVGVYPRGSVQKIPSSLSACTLSVPSVQALSTDSFDPCADLLISKVVSSSSLSQTFSLSLRRLVAIGKMTVLNLGTEDGEKILSVRFIATNTVMNGKVTIDPVAESVKKYGPGDSYVSLESPVGVSAAKSLSFYFTCLPFSLSKGEEYSVCIQTDRHSYVKTGTIPSGKLTFTESNLTCFSVDMAGITPTDCITYEMYGAIGDGTTDDMPAIVAAHKAANDYGIPVVADDSKTYLIGNVAKTATIKTDVDWGNAHFIINDNGLDKLGSKIFIVKSRLDTINLSGVSSLYRGATNLGISIPRRSLVCVTNSNKKIFIRSGSNANAGSDQAEYLVVEANGDISTSTPITWDYSQVTSLVAYPIDEDTLTIRGGIFTTKVSPEYSEEYYSRGIVVARSNTRLVGIKHFIEGEGPEGAPYHGFFTVNYCKDVELDSILFTAHKTYYKTGALGKLTAMGSYDLSLTKAVDILLKNCAQSTPILDSLRWGFMGSNFCRNLRFENSELSRFDAHQGVYNATLSNCIFGEINLTGFGTLTIEDCEIHSSDLLTFRGDYGSFFRGNVVFNNCKQYPEPDIQIHFVHAYHTGIHDYGYDCMLPTTITFNGLQVYDGSMTLSEYSGPFIFSNVNRKGTTYPYTIPQTIYFNNLWIQSGKSVTLGPSAEYYSGTSIITTNQ